MPINDHCIGMIDRTSRVYWAIPLNLITEALNLINIHLWMIFNEYPGGIFEACLGGGGQRLNLMKGGQHRAGILICLFDCVQG